MAIALMMSLLMAGKTRPIIITGGLRNDASRRWHKIASALSFVFYKQNLHLGPWTSGSLVLYALSWQQAEQSYELPAEILAQSPGKEAISGYVEHNYLSPVFSPLNHKEQQ